MNYEENIKKIDKMSHTDRIKNSHQYKDYLERHPETKKILANHYPSRKVEKVGSKAKALSKISNAIK